MKNLSVTESLFPILNASKLVQWSCKMLIVFLVLFVNLEFVFSQQTVQTNATPTMEALVKQTLKKNAETLRFMENKGQLDNKDILYYLEGKQGIVVIEKNRFRFIAKELGTIKNDSGNDEVILKGTHAFTINVNDANPDVKLVLGNAFGTKYNYILGEDSKSWISGVQAAKDLTLKDIYPGIDIRLYSNEDGSLEFDWLIYPGADYNKIDLRVEGQDNLTVDQDGNLNVGLRFTNVKFNIPESYQVTEKGKVPIDFSYVSDNKKQVGFKTNSIINPQYPLIIDPVLSWGTFMDGNDPDFDQYLFAIQVDPNNGMVYCAGSTNRNIQVGSPPYDADGYLNVIAGFGTSATPRVAIVYRINSTGSDLVDLTLYGPSAVSGSNTVVAYGISLSTNRVFIGGRTTMTGLPMVGGSFDNSFDNNDGFVAVFSRDLGTLHYSTYLGGTGSEDLGVTSIRAIDDNTFVCGLTAEAALPAAYISGGSAQTGFGGASDMWIGKFTTLSNLNFGTYIGDSGTEIFNDLELFPDGRVAFAGSGTESLTEVNSAASRSTGSDFDGIIGVLNSTGTAFNYLDEIGGSGDDKINDAAVNGSNIYWTGSSSNGFPTSAGAYSSSNNGGLDVVVGSVSDVGGGASYRATLFGGGGDDIGSGIKRVMQTQCDGTEEAFLLVFGTTENNANAMPTKNINGDPFFDATNNGGLDIYFAGFSDNMNSLVYATNIGGQYNDYLGDTGAPRGGNHLWVKGANVYCGTTTHSASHSPIIVGNTGFDQVKTNHGNPTSDDTHVLFSIQFTSLFETDYSDAPASYGTPSHILDCAHISINTLDAEAAPVPGVNANGDDIAGLDDEDGISTFPIYQSGGPQNITINVENVMNSTGSTATLYGWIDLNNDGNFDNNEIATTSVANGFNGTKTLTWSGVTVSGNPSNQYLRLRLTTDALSDDLSTASLDERSTESAENGEVEDYYICVKPKAGADKNVDCVATFPGGSATMAASGTGTWSAAAGNPGTASIVTPSSATTVINNFSVAGTYSFVWTNATSCATDTALVIVTAKPNAGGNQNVNCVASFPGGSATMGATGVGTWSAQAGNPGGATITSPNSPTTTIVNYTVAGTYNFIWTNSSGCTDTAIITVTAKPMAGGDKNVSCVVSFPGGSTSMNASGTGTWTAHPSNQSSTIVTPSSPTTTINNFAGEGTYLYIWTVGSCTDTAAVIVSKGPTGSASPQSICSGFTSSVALNSTIPGTTFTWTAAQQSGATITGYSDCNAACGTTIAQTLTNTTNNASGVVRYTVIPTAPNGCVGNSFTVDITVNPKPVGSGSNQTICSGFTTSISLSSTVANSTFTWTAAQLSGSTITGFSNCAAACGTTISQTLTNTSNAAPGTVRYTVTPTSPNGCAGNTFTVDVTVNPKPVGSASPETICSGTTTSVALSSTAAGSTFTWTAAQQSGAAITGFSNCAGACGTTIAQTLTNTTNNNAGVVRYTVTPTSADGCVGNTFTVDVTVNPKPGVTVTSTPACIGVSNGTATAVVTGGSGPFSYNWSNGQNSATIINLANGTYTVTVQDNNGCTNTASGTVQQQGISMMSANPSACNPSTNTYSVSGTLTLVNPPSSGTLTVSIGANQQVFNAPFSSPTNYTITGLTADGAVHTVNAVFSAGSQCSKSVNYTAPVNCQPIITHTKNFVSATQTGAHSFSVIYTITVGNTGGDGQYDLKDVPGFDDDITITNASYTTNAPGNPGGALAGTGPWTLANDQAILTGQTHTYTLTVNVSIDLSAGSGGNNSYTKCGTAVPGNPASGEGLYNESRLDTNNDGTPEETKKTCGDVPYLDMTKSVASINPLGGNMYNVLYTITVKNLGGANGQYDLTDAPAFENDIAIGSASYTSNAPGNGGGALAGTGPWILASDQAIIVGATHTYTLTVKVTLDLIGGGGDNVYTKCGASTPGDPNSGEGLYNQSKMDTNNDGINDETDEACGDLPYIITTKSVASINALGGNMYNVIYTITAQNIGGATGQYDLTDVPDFDDDITIGSASFTTNAPGNPGGALAGSGPWTLANDQNISVGATHTYTLTVKVTVDLRPSSGGNNVYTKCGTATPGDPAAGEGLYNQAKMDANNDGIPEETKEACGDVPYITTVKTVSSITPLGGNMYNVTYQVLVKNTGGANGSYDLVDAPGFDNDFVINSSSYTSNAPGNAGSALAGSGPWTLANDQAILTGATHTYSLVVKVTLDLTPGSGGDNVYTACGSTNPGDPSAGEGLYNRARVDINNDGIPEDTSETCADVPYITSNKSLSTIAPLGGNMYNVTYTITVQNLGATAGQYDLLDVPAFDNDITIGSASYTSTAPGNAGGALVGTGPWTLANDQAIVAGGTHTYSLVVKVTLDLTTGSGGNDIYTKCGSSTPGNPTAGEGLYNESRMDSNNDGTPEETKKACGDLPYIVTTKTFSTKTDLGGNMYNVNYTITVQNLGGANGQYDLTDLPGFDDDITINNASYTSNAPGNGGVALAGTGPWTLANDQAILVGAIHTYTLTVKVTLDLNTSSGGNNTYTKCGASIPGDPGAGEGLYNQSNMDTNNDGIPEDVDEACGDLPYVSTTKTVASISPLGGNMFEVKYTIKVTNSGGANGQYDLTDIPGFDDDIAINSSSYASDAPGNSGGSLAGAGPWTLANNQAIGIGAIHTYTLTVKVTIDLNPGSGGNNIYTSCGSGTPGDPTAGEGLYNQSRMDTNNDGIPEDIDEACGDLPYITSTKSIGTIAPLGGNMYNVTYHITVQNLGAVNGQYDLTDIPGFDNDISIGSASYTTTAPGNPGGALAGSGPWTLANDQAITAGASHSYTILVKITLNLEPGSGGDDVYTKCGAVTPGDPNAGEGLYNQSKLDSNNDSIAEETKEACGDIPYVSAAKTITSTTALGGNMYNVTYSIVVRNLGGAAGQYDLTDVPAFDNDITIGSASYITTAPGNPGGALAGIGPWSLANDQSIAIGATHTYTLTVKVTLDLNPGSGGDDTYTKCGAVNPGDPNTGEGLYNQSKLDSNNDGTPEDVDEVCGDLPYVTSTKTISTITNLGGNMYNVTYAIVVKNLGGVNGTYDLSDLPGFDNDIAIGSASFISTAPGNPGGGLAGNGPWTLANDQVIGVGATHTYTLTVKVTLDLRVGTGGDNIYTKCGNATPGDPSSGEGLYNQSRLDSNNDGTPEETKEACGDLPYIVNTKTVNSITPLGGNMFNVKYNIAVKNIGGTNGQYDLTDVPGFDNDFAIGSASYVSDAPGNAGNALAGSGPWTLANDQAITVGATHNYTVTVKVTLDLSPGSGGDNVYTKCGVVNPSDPNSGEGLYNQTQVDINNDGIPEDTSETCADIPYVTSAKTINSITSLGGHMYNVVYKIVVRNLGGVAGQYDLLDVPGFDNDITIGSASYSSDAPGNAGGSLAGVGPWSLANDQGINANATHTYLVTVKVTLDLNAASGGDNIYTKCGQLNPNSPQSGEGLYNESRMDSNNDGTPEEVSKVCGDLPYIVSNKSVTSVTPLGGNMFNVSYKMVVQNLGGINGPYDLTDVPGFDDDITVNSASYITDAPGNPGGPLAGIGPWVLANDQNIINGAVHTYNLTVKVTLNLDPASPGNNSYTKCGTAIPGDPTTGEGLYNQSKLDINNDGIPEDVDEACGDVPYVSASKSISSITPLGSNMYTVKYQINVQNLGGTAGMYDLVDQPGLDDDITLGAVSYTSDAPGNSGGSLVGNGPWTLANDQAIGIGSTHSYVITAKVTLDLTIGSSGDNVYTKCGNGIPGDPTAGEGLYNQSRLDNNNDGIPEELDEVCGDLPYVTTTKTLTNISNLGGHMYNVTYQLEVKNLGGANGQYDLTDIPGFDNDIAIGLASYVSTAPGNPGSALIGSGPWTLANDQNIGAFSTHTYTLTVKVTLNLETGSGGDDIYAKCGAIIPGDPNSGEGLYNQSKMDSNNDGIPEELREACGDLPYVVNAKTIASITPLGGNMYNVVYQLVVRNLGGTNGMYDLVDIPGFDNDIVINSASFTTTGPGFAGALAGVGPWTLANDLAIASGATHTYTITVKVTIQMEGGVGNDVYTKCGNAIPGDPIAGEGLYNQAKLDINNDDTPEDIDEACGDLPYVTAAKTLASITNLGGHMYNVTYNVVVRNIGGAIGQYDLNDIPGFDDDIAINSASFTSNAPGNSGGPLVGSGPWNLANDQNINAGSTHTYVLTVKVTIDLRATSGGDNIYTACGQLSTPGDPSPGEGLYNLSTMDSNNDGIPEEYDETCADLPYVVSSKTITNIIPLGGGMHTINYQLQVQNLGGAVGQYDLTDAPGFDNDLTINTASYTTTAPGNPGGALAGSGPWVLANDQSIGIGSTHNYNLTVKATLDFRPGSGGDNVYSECGKTTPGTPKTGEGVFNQSRMDINNDGTPEDTDDVCGDIDIVDMAIRKTTVTAAPYSYGQLITFNLEVFNQGNITLTSIILNDYLPSGFTFSPADNIAGWSLINPALLEYNAVASIPKYSSVIVPLTLRVAMSSGYKAWFNYSEVKSYKDVSGLDRTFEELDSKPNSNTPAELAVLPGDPGDDNINTMEIGGNEDDHDPAGFNVFDLALRKISKGANPLTYGEVVPFEITLFNQGSISAMNPQVTDYVPTGFQFVQANNPTWTYNAGTREASTTYVGKIKPGDSVKLTINLTLLPNLGNPRAWDNIGEIETVTDTLGNVMTDFDSSPGGTKDDDGPAIDDAINDPNDQDDHDPSVGPVFDLALRKYVKNKLPYYAPGDNVPYTITVFNQGNITAKNIQVNDYMPQGYVFDAGVNPGWSFVGSTLVYNSIAKLYPGDSVQLLLNLKVQIAAVPNLSDWDNYAEIRTANDTLDTNRDNDDADSKPNTDNAWERQVVENHIWDNVIDGNGQIENEDEDDHDFENVKVTGAVGGEVWKDTNGNGIQDPSEPKVSNVIVTLYECGTGILVKKDTTDVSGKYLFDALIPLKAYIVRFTNPDPDNCGFTLQDVGVNDGLDSDVDVNGVGPCTYLDPGERDTTYDAGLVAYASYGDYVWHDKDADGQQEAGEEGVQGVTVFLYDGITHLPVRTTITDINGFYLFEKLYPGNYYAKYTFDPIWNITDANVGNDLRDSDVDGSNGPRTNATTLLSPGEDDLSWDVGVWKCVNVIGDVWLDFDKDGIYDPNEKGINGLSVHLINALTGAIVYSVVTGLHPTLPSGDGYFKFGCVKPGRYYMRTDRPGPLGASDPYKGNDRNKDSDITHENGINTTAIFTVRSADVLSGYGAGFQVKSVVGDHVWFDKNFNGIQDLTEAPIKDVLVQAIKDNGVIVSEAISGSDGNYMLDGMVQGDYFVKFTPPAGNFGFTTSNMGDENVDSDVDGTNGYGTTKMYRLISGDELINVDAGLVATILPLEWLSFEGSYNGSFTELDWMTGVEINNEHFIVERKHESEKNFVEIGRELSQNNVNSAANEYNHNDYNVTQSGVYYYRIKQVDRDGSFTYSKTIAIRVAAEADLKVFIYPNPVDDLLKIEIWLGEDAEIEARVIDENGKVVIERPFDKFMKAGKKQEFLNTSVLPTGHYVIQVKTASGFVNKKFSVAR